MVAFQEWQDRRLALFDAAAGFGEARGGPEIFDSAFQVGDRGGSPACGHVNLPEIQVKSWLIALQPEGGFAELGCFAPLFFGARDGQAEKRKFVSILAFY